MAAAIPMAISAGMGLIGHQQKQAEYNRKKQLGADIERNSAWTNVHGEMPGAAPNLGEDLVNSISSPNGGASAPILANLGMSSWGGGKADPMKGASKVGGSGAGMSSYTGSGDELGNGGGSGSRWNSVPNLFTPKTTQQVYPQQGYNPFTMVT